MCHLLLLRRADRSIDEGCKDLAIAEFFHIRLFEVHRDRPEHDIDCGEEANDSFGQIDDRFFAAAARSAPIEGDLRLCAAVMLRER